MKTATLTAALILSSVVVAADSGTMPQPLVGSPAPSFRLTSLAGESVALEDLRGKLVVLHFGTGW